jgi:excisionase family DNA binding protein
MEFAIATDSATTGDAGHHHLEQDLDTLLTVTEVAAILKVSTSWVYEHTRSRGTPRSERLPHIKIGKYLRFDARAVRAFLETKCRAT